MNKFFLVLALTWLALLGHVDDAEARDRRVPIVAGGGGGMSITALGKGRAQGAGVVPVTTNSFSVTTGDCLVVPTMTYGSIGTNTVISNSGSAITWTLVVAGAQGSDTHHRCALYTGVAASTGSITVTSTPDPTGSIFASVGVGRINGCTTPTTDGTPGTDQNSGTSATVSLPSTSTNGVVVAVAGWNSNANGSAGSGYTFESTMGYPDNNVDEALAVISRVTAAGTYTPTVTLDASDQWVMCAAAFKP